MFVHHIRSVNFSLDQCSRTKTGYSCS